MKEPSGVITTARLTLREVSPDDWCVILAILNDPDFIRFVGDRGVRTETETRSYIEERFIRSYRENGFGLWMVVLRDSGRSCYIGTFVSPFFPL